MTGFWARLRVAQRLARRQVRRAPGAGLLVAALVALPVAALTASATFWQSQQPTPQQRVTLQLGQAQSWLGPGAGSPDMRQYVDAPNMLYRVSTPRTTAVHVQDPVSAAIPASARTLPVSEYASAVVSAPNGPARVDAVVGDVWDPLLAGRYLVLGGRAPAAPDEAMASPGLLALLHARLGDEVVLPTTGEPVTITGLLRRADVSPDHAVLFLPPTAAGAAGADPTVWYVADWQPSFGDLDALNDRGIVAYARDLVLDPPPDARLSSSDGAGGAFWTIAATAAAAAVFGGYLTVLLAGAALSVSSRRQQRTLAVAASVGAGRADLFRVILLQGSVLGAGGGVAGLLVGVAAAAAVLAMTDDGVAGSVLHGNWGFRIPWALLAAILLFAVVAGTCAAIAPARAASRGDTIAALRGARRPGRVDARRPVWGLALLLGGLALTLGGGALLAAVEAASRSPEITAEVASALRIVAQWMIVLGPVVLQVGVLIAGHWILSQCARPLARLGLASRLASRDAAAHPSRVVPAFAAIAGCVFLAAFALSATAVTAAGAARAYISTTPIGSLTVTVWAEEPDRLPALLARARGMLAETDPVATVLVQQPADGTYEPTTGDPTDPDLPLFRVGSATADPGCGFSCAADRSLTIVAATDLDAFLGESVPADARDVFRDGGALVLDRALVSGQGTIRIDRWRAADLTEYGRTGTTTHAPQEELTVPAATLTLPHRSDSTVLISPETAERIGAQPVPSMLVATYDEPPAAEVVDRLQADAEVLAASGEAGIGVWLERGPTAPDPWLWLMTAVAAVLVVGVSGVCLGLARFERRPDDATLAAVGGEPRLRRRVNAWQALVIVGLGSVTGTVAGTLPMLGVAIGSGGYLSGADSPWGWLATLAILFPLGVAAASWLVPPRRPDLTRRQVIS